MSRPNAEHVGRIGQEFQSGLFRREFRDGDLWVPKYTAAFDDALRSVIRDESAGEERVWAVAILKAWGIALDPALYPFVRPLTHALRNYGDLA